MPKRRLPRDIQLIEDIAWQVLQEFLWQFTNIGQPAPKIPPVPVQDIARLLAGLDLEPVRGLQYQDQKLSGFLEPDIQLISYESDDIPARQLFSVAHELGHYYLHYKSWLERQSLPTLFPLEDESDVGSVVPRTPTYYRCSVADISLSQRSNDFVGGVDQGELLQALRVEQQRAHREAEANWFGAALLMPEPLIDDLLRAGYSSPHQLARQLGVSALAAEVRLVRLGLLDKLSRDRRSDDPTQKRFT
jgi:hypothetical protein